MTTFNSQIDLARQIVNRFFPANTFDEVQVARIGRSFAEAGITPESFDDFNIIDVGSFLLDA